MKQTSVILILSLTLPFQTYAQPTPTEVPVKSCTTRLNEIFSNAHMTKDEIESRNESGIELVAPVTGVIVAGLTGAAINAGNHPVSDKPVGTEGFLMGAASALVITGVYFGTKAIIWSHRKNILAIFNGATIGGNIQTKKLWKLVNRKYKNSLHGMTYEEFLEAIHKSDISGKACEFKDIPGKRSIAKSVVTMDELDATPIAENNSPGPTTQTTEHKSPSIKSGDSSTIQTPGSTSPLLGK